VIVSLAWLVVGCESSRNEPSNSESGARNPDSPLVLNAAAPEHRERAPETTQGRGQLWTQTCNRCHNARSPDSYSANEWATVMAHMRIRGYLTGQEQRAILEFLQSQ
jgi:hypothetical protein